MGVATYTYVKSAGAPAGRINFLVGNDSYFIDDGANPTIVTSDSSVGGSPYLTLQGVSGAFDPLPLTEDVFLVNGVLSKRGAAGVTVPVDVGGGDERSITSVVYGDPRFPDRPTSFVQGGVLISFTYNSDGSYATMTNAATGKTTTYSYDAQGRPNGTTVI